MNDSRAYEASMYGYKYQVFLSFRGEDTRTNFSGHLYRALEQEGIRTFRDDDAIERGENIDSGIRRAIQQSEGSAIVISKDYASSRWCLGELVMILDHKRAVGHYVVPVFYHVDPSDVWDQTGTFAEAFAVHSEIFNDDMDQLNRWRAALREVAELSGLVLQHGDEAKFIRDIVREIRNKVKPIPLYVPSFHVGLDSLLKSVNSWVRDATNNVKIGLICGIGGVGKTTIAKIVYNQNFESFEDASFVSDIRGTSEQSNGIVRLQRKLLSDIQKRKKVKIGDKDEGIMKIKDAIRCRRVLIVLDDIDDSEYFHLIIKMQDQIARGSKIIVTTRHKRLKIVHNDETCMKFEVRPLEKDDSLKLFSWHAFGQTHPEEDKLELSKRALKFCGGLPLALEILGSALSGKNADVWESALQEIEAFPNWKILKILRVSFDSLSDHHKMLFLDIACFFIGKKKHYVSNILYDYDHGIDPANGIQNLIERNLIENCGKTFEMHCLLRDMGREIVRQESPDDVEKRSRLWDHKDAFSVLKEETGTEYIRGLTLHMEMLKEEEFIMIYRRQHQNLKIKSFEKMKNLKFLNLSTVNVTGNVRKFPKKVIWLRWDRFSLKSIPTNLELRKLVILDMRHSSLTNVWKGIKPLPMLKILNLSHSHTLVRTPDFSEFPSLERLELKHCLKLVEIDPSIGDLQKLVFVNLMDCTSLQQLPEEIGKLQSLREIDLSGCLKLGELPIELQKRKLLGLIRIDRIKAFFSSCLALGKINSSSSPFSVTTLPHFLVNLYIQDCNLKDSAVPEAISRFSSLEILCLSGNPIRSLPESIKNIATLKELYLSRCERLQHLPELPTSLLRLDLTNCFSLERIANLQTLFESLHVLTSGCGELSEIPNLFRKDPITDAEVKMFTNVGLFRMGELASTEVFVYSQLSHTARITHPQILHECGMFSLFLTKIPSWLNDRNESFLSLEVSELHGHHICGLNLYVLYANNEATLSTTAPLDLYMYALISNKTKATKWVYSPIFVGIPHGNNELLWISHWKFHHNQIESGDQVDILVKPGRYFRLKTLDVHLVYGMEEPNEVEATSSNLRDRTLSDRDLLPYNGERPEYVLNNYGFLIRQSKLFAGHPEIDFLHLVISSGNWESLRNYLGGEFI